MTWELLHDVRRAFDEETGERQIADSNDTERITNTAQIKTALVESDMAELFSSLKSYHRRNRRDKADVRAADEILAYVAGGADDADIVNILLRSKKQGGLYDYAYREKQKNWHSLLPLYGAEKISGREATLLTTCFNSARDEIYIDEYKQLIMNGVTALTSLAEHVGKEEAIAMLTHEPLSKWEKTVDRIISNENKEKS